MERSALLPSCCNSRAMLNRASARPVSGRLRIGATPESDFLMSSITVFIIRLSLFSARLAARKALSGSPRRR